MLFASLGALAASVGSSAFFAQAPAAPLAPFPFADVDIAVTSGVELLPLTDLFGDLAALDRVTLTGVPLPGGAAALRLKKLEVASPSALLWVDGSPQGPLADGSVSLWSGTVAGERDSEVFLALSPSGSRGWISTSNATHHLLAGPDSSGDWAAPTARLVSDAAFRAEGHQPGSVCRSNEIEQPATPELPIDVRTLSPSKAGVGGSMLRAYVALESDSQYYDIFGDLSATVSYTLALMGAVSHRYREDIGVLLTISHLSLYTDAASDPWTAGDAGGSCIDQLFEYQDATLSGNVNGRGELYSFLSGSNFGCGVAYLPGLCDPFYNFSVMGNLEGLLDFPVEQGPLNWDFIVVAHELGHNFGAPHTHDWCPEPLDECAPDWAGFGACQDEQVCLEDAYVMSYCHLCPGGYDNINLHFHPVSKQAMRETALGCLNTY